MNSNPGLRPTGVVPTTQSDRAPVNTVVHMQPLDFFGILFGDETGQAHVDVVVKMGDTWYKPPNSEDWARAMRPLATWMKKQLEERYKASKEDLPKEDAVDVLAEAP